MRAEIERDLQAEAEIMQKVISIFPDRYDGYMKLPVGWKLDGMLIKHHDYGFVIPKLFYECKDRRIPFGRGPDYFISATKLYAARMHSEATSLRCWLIARFTDGTIAALDFARHEANKFRFGGRQDRLNGADVFVHDSEMLAVFQWTDFIILCEGQE
jgi:hypothetical protein